MEEEVSQQNYKKVLIVVIAIGEWYNEFYKRNFHKSHEIYAKKQGYDLKVIDYMLDTTINHFTAFSFQKILVCSQDWSKNYDYIISVDADIFINPNSPPIHTCIDFKDKIGIVDEHSQIMTVPDDPNLYKELSKDFSDLEHIDTKLFLNTGLLVLQPKLHGNFLYNIFKKYVHKCQDNKIGGFAYEQRVIGYELIKNNMFILVPDKFNAIWYFCKSNPETDISMELFFENNYFTHFAANCDLYYFNKYRPLHKYLE